MTGALVDACGLLCGEDLRDKLSGAVGEKRDSVLKQVRCYGLLLRFERAIATLPTFESRIHRPSYWQMMGHQWEWQAHQKACKALLRNNAFALLDWIPALSTVATTSILVNTLIQSAYLLLRAEHYGTPYDREDRHRKVSIALKADETLALRLYQEAFALARRSPPTVMLYAMTQILMQMHQFYYCHEDFKPLVTLFNNTLTRLLDIFPFIASQCSNIALYKASASSLDLMRAYMKSLYTLYRNPSLLHVDPIKLHYQIFEALLRGWYEDHVNKPLKDEVRLELMRLMLEEKDLTLEDVSRNFAYPYVLTRQNEDGWVDRNKSLPFPESPDVELLQSVDGIEINIKTGNIEFITTKWTLDKALNKGVISNIDLRDMVRSGINSGFFSLDQVDPNRPRHPFQHMRYHSALHGTEFMQVMLITDYLLKFFTVGSQVQALPPFNQQSIEPAFESLPPHLKAIFDRFHAAQKNDYKEKAHHFWIEALEAPIAVDSDEQFIRFAAAPVKMILKKKLQQRDRDGNLEDADERDEGWPIYLLTSPEMDAFFAGDLLIQAPALLISVVGEHEDPAKAERRRRWEAVHDKAKAEEDFKLHCEPRGHIFSTVGESSSSALFGDAQTSAKGIRLLPIPDRFQTFSNVYGNEFDDRFPPLYRPRQEVIEIQPEDLKEFDTAAFFFVIMPNHEFRIGLDHEHFMGGHIDLSGGDDVISAGTFQLYQGKLYCFSLSSGHYMPKGISAERVIEMALDQAGFETRGKYHYQEWGDDEREDHIRFAQQRAAKVMKEWSTKPSGSGGA